MAIKAIKIAIDAKILFPFVFAILLAINGVINSSTNEIDMFIKYLLNIS